MAGRAGEILFDFGERGTVHARAGDVVIAPRLVRHTLTVVGTEPAVRLSVNVPNAEHVWDD